MKCSKCQFGNPEAAKFCIECGNPMEFHCPQCGAITPPTGKFCMECGHDLTTPSKPIPKDLSLDEKIDKIQRYLPKGLTEKISFGGNIPIGEVRRLMAESDIILHPSLTPEDGDREGIPNALMEGQATGLPVVSTRHGGIPELIVDGETGLLFPYGDHAALAEKVINVLIDKELYARLTANSIEWSQRFTWDECAEKTKKIADEIVHT